MASVFFNPSNFDTILPLSPTSHLINECLKRLKDQKIFFINLVPKSLPNLNHDYYVSFEINGMNEPISIFSFKNTMNEQYINAKTLELTEKITQYLNNKKDPNMLLLPSGAMIKKHTEVSIEIDDGFLKIDGKIVVYKENEEFIPLHTKHLHTYTSFESKKENDLFIISDDYDKIRTDGLNDGFVFNLKKPIQFQDKQYLLLYRSKEEALEKNS